MDVHEAIRAAERLLPGAPAPDGELDPRWQAIIEIGNQIELEPEAVWDFIERWGVHPDEDIRAAVSTCLLEHLLESWFEPFFPKVERAVRSSRLFADMYLRCSWFGPMGNTTDARRFDALQAEARELAR